MEYNQSPLMNSSQGSNFGLQSPSYMFDMPQLYDSSSKNTSPATISVNIPNPEVDTWHNRLFDFAQMTPKEQLKLLSKEDYQHIVVPLENVSIPFHQHPLKRHSPGEAIGWDCDARKKFGVCLSGLTDFYQSNNVEGWSCRKCNFDVCKKCLQALLAIQIIQEKED